MSGIVLNAKRLFLPSSLCGGEQARDKEVQGEGSPARGRAAGSGANPDLFLFLRSVSGPGFIPTKPFRFLLLNPHLMNRHLLATLSVFAAFLAPAFAQDEAKLEVSSNDQMQYDKKALEVVTGQKVTVVFKYVGALPKAAMAHNIVILQAGTAVPGFAMKAMAAAASGYIPQDEDSKKLILAHSETIGAGETSTFSFVAPAPGAYPYVCTFPGHFALMQGVLTVKEK